jgi:hypothetical protein
MDLFNSVIFNGNGIKFFTIEQLNIDKIMIFAYGFMIVFNTFEFYWAMYKWNMASKASKSCSQSIDGRRKISIRKGEMVLESYWSTPWSGKGEQGYYFYNCDFDFESGNWKQTGFECKRD